MALKACRECGKEVSTEAKQCPNCGVAHPTSQMSSGTKGALGCLAVIGLVTLIGVMSQSGGDQPSPPSRVPPTSNQRPGASKSTPRKAPPPTTTPRRSDVTGTGLRQIVDDHRFGCTDPDYFGKIIQYAVQKDQEAFARALSDGMSTGLCTLFTRGETVYLTDSRVFSGLVRVRRRGETAEYWTNTEAVQ